ncbi:hypothetical protein BDV12DRAFT_200174 [Aspergillus spectabilis]
MVFILNDPTFFPCERVSSLGYVQAPSSPNANNTPLEFLQITGPPSAALTEDPMTIGTILNGPFFDMGSVAPEEEDSDLDIDMFEDALESHTSSVVMLSRRPTNFKENANKRRKADTEAKALPHHQKLQPFELADIPNNDGPVCQQVPRTVSQCTLAVSWSSLSNPEEDFDPLPDNWWAQQSGLDPYDGNTMVSPRCGSPPPLFEALDPGLHSISTVSAFLRREDREEDNEPRAPLCSLSHAEALAELEAARTHNWELKLKNSRYLNDLALSNRELAIAEKLKGKLKGKLEAADKTIEKLYWKAESTEKTVHIMTSQVQVTSREIMRLRDELARTHSELGELRPKARQVDTAQRKIAKLEREIAGMKKAEEKNSRAFTW